MKYFYLLLFSFIYMHVWAQPGCTRNSPLWRFDPHAKPRVFTERLGNHPQFPFLQQEKGVTTSAAFLKAAKDSGSRQAYPVEFKFFNVLLKEIGFVRGYKDLKISQIRDCYVSAGTIGNLGYYNKDVEGNAYIYVQLNPSGESTKGVAAWKIKGPSGCWLYILHTCGNAFYPNADPGAGTGGCCRDVRAETRINPVEFKAPVRDRPMHIRVSFYKAIVYGNKRRKDGHRGRDTVVSLIRSVDTVTVFRDTSGKSWKVYARDVTNNLMVCRDTVIQLRPELAVDSSGSGPDSIKYYLSDTTYLSLQSGGETPCHKKWEIAADGGISYNSIPRFDNVTTHTRTDGSHPVGELSIARIFKPWFLAGVSASYMSLSYEDDVAYAGATPNTYSTVYVGKPVIPVQLFGKFVIGGPLRWQSDISFSAGYAFVSGDKVVNSGTQLAVDPGVKGGITAGVKYGVAYFFSCKFGIGASVRGQYFSNKATSMNYHLVALPVTLGIRYRL